MRRLFAVALVVCLWFGFAPPASASLAGDNVSGLTPCGENAAFQQRAANASTEKAKARFDFYGNSSLLCGEDGLPHLVVEWRFGPCWRISDSQHSVSLHRRLDWLGWSVLPDCRSG
jgi:hypothetical protein